jgi:hypothetical protein
MLSTLRTAIDSTIVKRLTAGADCFTGPPLDLDRFFVAIDIHRWGVRPLRPDPDASLSKLVFDRAPPSHAA